MSDHRCKRDELKWETTPHCEGDCVCFVGKCPVCGKEYEQVFTETDGLWDRQKEEYVYI